MYKVTDFPKRIEIELSNKCNLNCFYCPRRFLVDRDGFIDYNLFKNIIDEIKAYPESILVLHRRGESLLHPNFTEMLNYVKGKFKKVQLATNATFMDHEKAKIMIECLDFISFSLDIPERYEKIKGIDYQKVLKNIDYFLNSLFLFSL